LTKNYFLYNSLLTVFQRNIFYVADLNCHKKGVLTTFRTEKWTYFST